MSVVTFNIIFDQPNKVYHPGQHITGKVELVTKYKLKIRGVELKIKGRAKCQLYYGNDCFDDEGNPCLKWVRPSFIEKEVYMKNEILVCGGKGKLELPVGEHSYPFSVMLPYKIPSSFKGTYGDVVYYAKAKIDIPYAPDKEIKQSFTVKNFLDLNQFPNLRIPFKSEKSKTFNFWCCTSGPLTITAQLSSTGFARPESVPITLDVDNCSNVEVDSIHMYLEGKINWKAEGNHKNESIRERELFFGSIAIGQSQTWNEIIDLPTTIYPYLENCGIIKIGYELRIEVKISGMHSDLDLHLPLTIGDIPFCHNGNQNLTVYQSTPPYNPEMIPPNSTDDPSRVPYLQISPSAPPETPTCDNLLPQPGISNFADHNFTNSSQSLCATIMSELPFWNSSQSNSPNASPGKSVRTRQTFNINCM